MDFGFDTSQHPQPQLNQHHNQQQAISSSVNKLKQQSFLDQPQQQQQHHQADPNLFTSNRNSFGSINPSTASTNVFKSPTLSHDTIQSYQSHTSDGISIMSGNNFVSNFQQQNLSNFQNQLTNHHQQQQQQRNPSQNNNPFQQQDPIPHLDQLPLPHPQFQNGISSTPPSDTSELPSQPFSNPSSQQDHLQQQQDHLQQQQQQQQQQRASSQNSLPVPTPPLPPPHHQQNSPQQYIHPHLAQRQQLLHQQQLRQEELRQRAAQHRANNPLGHLTNGVNLTEFLAQDSNVQTISDPDVLLNGDIPIFLDKDGQFKSVIPVLHSSARKRPRRQSASLSAGATCEEITNFRLVQQQKRAQMSQRSIMNSPVLGPIISNTPGMIPLDPKTKSVMRRTIQDYREKNQNKMSIGGGENGGSNCPNNTQNHHHPWGGPNRNNQRKSLNINVTFSANILRQSNPTGTNGNTTTAAAAGTGTGLVVGSSQNNIKSTRNICSNENNLNKTNEFDDDDMCSSENGDNDDGDDEFRDTFEEPLTPFSSDNERLDPNLDNKDCNLPLSSSNPFNSFNRTPFRPQNRSNPSRMTTASYGPRGHGSLALATPAPNNSSRPILQGQFRGQHKLAKKQSKMLLDQQQQHQHNSNNNTLLSHNNLINGNNGDLSSGDLNTTISMSQNDLNNNRRRGIRIGGGSGNGGGGSSLNGTNTNLSTISDDIFSNNGGDLFAEENDPIYPNEILNQSLSGIFDEFDQDELNTGFIGSSSGAGGNGINKPLNQQSQTQNNIPKGPKLVKKKPATTAYQVQIQQNTDNTMFGTFDANNNGATGEAAVEFPLFVPKVQKNRENAQKNNNLPFQFRSPTKDDGYNSEYDDYNDDCDDDDDDDDQNYNGKIGGNNDKNQFGFDFSGKKTTTSDSFFGNIKRRNVEKNDNDDDLIWVSLVPQPNTTTLPDGTLFTPNPDYEVSIDHYSHNTIIMTSPTTGVGGNGTTGLVTGSNDNNQLNQRNGTNNNNGGQSSSSFDSFYSHDGSNEQIPIFDPMNLNVLNPPRNINDNGNSNGSNLGRFSSISEHPGPRQRQTPTQPPPCIRRQIKTRLSLGHQLVGGQMNDVSTNPRDNSSNIIYIEQTKPQPLHQISLHTHDGQPIVLGTIVHTADLSDGGESGPLKFDDDDDDDDDSNDKKNGEIDADDMVNEFQQLFYQPNNTNNNNNNNNNAAFLTDNKNNNIQNSTAAVVVTTTNTTTTTSTTPYKFHKYDLLPGFEDLLAPNSGSITTLNQRQFNNNNNTSSISQPFPPLATINRNQNQTHTSPGRFGTISHINNSRSINRFNSIESLSNSNDTNTVMGGTTPIRPHNPPNSNNQQQQQQQQQQQSSSMFNETPIKDLNMTSSNLSSTAPASSSSSVGRFGRPTGRFGAPLTTLSSSTTTPTSTQFLSKPLPITGQQQQNSGNVEYDEFGFRVLSRKE